MSQTAAIFLKQITKKIPKIALIQLRSTLRYLEKKFIINQGPKIFDHNDGQMTLNLLACKNLENKFSHSF